MKFLAVDMGKGTPIKIMVAEEIGAEDPKVAAVEVAEGEKVAVISAAGMTHGLYIVLTVQG